MAREMLLAGVSEEELHPTPAPPPPSTPRGKWENFWYHYKWPVIAGLAAVFVLTVLIVQTITRPRPDYRIAVVTQQPLSTDALTMLRCEMTLYGQDVNGNGEVLLSTENLVLASMLSSGLSNTNYETDNQKLQAYLLSGEVMFYVFDEESYQNFTTILDKADYEFFETLSVDSAGYDKELHYWDWYQSDAQQSEWGQKLPEHLYFGVRCVSGTASSAVTAHDTCQELLTNFINQNLPG